MGAESFLWYYMMLFGPNPCILKHPPPLLHSFLYHLGLSSVPFEIAVLFLDKSFYCWENQDTGFRDLHGAQRHLW